MPRREGGRRTSVKHIVVSGYEKRKQPSKHYVFVIDITWDNDERYEVLRRYSEFFTLHETLKLVFPPGKQADPDSTLPLLPNRKFFGRSHVEKVAEARVESINKYCQGLIRLNAKLSQSKHVIGFFSPKIGDRTLPKLRLQRPASLYPQIRPAGNTVWEEYCVIAAFIGEGASQLSADSGDQVRVVNKDQSGWWLIERRGKVGWIPESYLKKASSTLKKEDYKEFLGLIDTEAKSNGSSSDDGVSMGGSDSRESSPGIEVEAQDYKAIDSYTATEPGQLSFQEDDVITVLDKMEDGWWFVTKDKQEGWVPCGYLEPLSQDQDTDEESHSESAMSDLDKVEKYKTVAAYTAEEEDEISFSAGSIATVLHKSLTGWWMIRCGGKVGLAPATYLKYIEEDDESNNSDSGNESGTGVGAVSMIGVQRSLKFSPRQQTVRKKRSRKAVSVPKTSIKEEPDKKDLSPEHSSRKTSSPNIRPKPQVTPRKFSNPSSPGINPPVKQMASLGVNTPPRPRQTLINRAYHTPKDDEDEFEERRANRKLSASQADRRSPSPVRRSRSPVRHDPAPQKPVNKTNHSTLNGNSEQAHKADGNPYTQQAAESLIKYVLASNDPNLKSALIKVVSSDPEILKALKQ